VWRESIKDGEEKKEVIYKGGSRGRRMDKKKGGQWY